MSRVIYKYELWPWQNDYAVGGNPVVRHVDEQDGKPFMWVEQDTSGEPATIKIEVVGTGFSMDDVDRRFIGTVMLRTDGLVLHVFELPAVAPEEGDLER